MAVITRIQALPSDPFEGTGVVGIAITNGLECYFKILGENLDQIIDTNWYPKRANSVEFEIRDIILVDDTCGTFMIQVINNMLDSTDRGGKISFRITDGSTISFPVKTYGPVSLGPLWTAPQQGLITG